MASIKRVFTSEISSNHLGKKVNVIGWVEDIRFLGSLIFLTIRDISGFVQVVLKKSDSSTDLFNSAKSVVRQSIVLIQGIVKESKAKEANLEIQAENMEILSIATHPLPIDPTGRVPSSLDLRLDSRALDLRDPSSLAVFKIRHTTLQSFRKFLINERFLEVNTPKIIGQAVEGGATLFKVDYFGNKAFLAQSPQLYKEQLTLSMDRVFEISTYFRAEKSHTRRHLNEFVSEDIEAAFLSKEDVMNILEKMIKKTIQDISKYCKDELKLLKRKLIIPKIPFKRISYSDAINDLNESGLKRKIGDDLDTIALKKLGKMHKGFYFITDWSTKIKPFYIEIKEENNELSESFDLMYGHIELASGGQRVSNKDELESRLVQSKLNLESFKDHLKAFSWGMPPHSGWGLGVDRFVMVITGLKNIHEVVLYPRDRFRLTP